MEWTPGGISNDIEDRRDDSEGGGGFRFGGFHVGCGGLILLGILSLLFHRNLFTLLSNQPGAVSVQSRPDYAQDQREQPEVQFVSFVLDDVQNNWARLLPEAGKVPYHHAKLVLFRDAYPSGCGLAQDAIGPFYCSEDQKVYLDLSFFDELRSRFRAPGEFAEAYVIAHELGHHVQDLLGTLPKVHRLEQSRPDDDGSYLIGTSKTVNLQLRDGTLAKTDPSVTLHFDFHVKRGTYLIRLVVRDTQSGAMSTFTRPEKIT
ncbi:MAG TPA: neutral zinc metallopeptidase [Bryobacteraceae bacterium]|nr:neutral zinc metallopeptidase [Bryobacteraceae bacterium]